MNIKLLLTSLKVFFTAKQIAIFVITLFIIYGIVKFIINYVKYRYTFMNNIRVIKDDFIVMFKKIVTIIYIPLKACYILKNKLVDFLLNNSNNIKKYREKIKDKIIKNDIHLLNKNAYKLKDKSQYINDFILEKFIEYALKNTYYKNGELYVFDMKEDDFLQYLYDRNGSCFKPNITTEYGPQYRKNDFSLINICEKDTWDEIIDEIKNKDLSMEEITLLKSWSSKANKKVLNDYYENINL